jgi:hypothetical protein
MHALSFVSMGVEARCCLSKSTAHLPHMKRQPFLHNGRPHCGRRHCHCCRHLRCHCRLHCRCCCRGHRNHPLPLPLPLAIAVAVSVNHCRHHLCCVAVSHCCCRRPCRRPLPSPSPSAITIAMPLAITAAMPLDISEHCCLGAARILFNQLKQRMLTLFYIVCTVGGALIKAE